MPNIDIPALFILLTLAVLIAVIVRALRAGRGGGPKQHQKPDRPEPEKRRDAEPWKAAGKPDPGERGQGRGRAKDEGQGRKNERK